MLSCVICSHVPFVMCSHVSCADNLQNPFNHNDGLPLHSTGCLWCKKWHREPHAKLDIQAATQALRTFLSGQPFQHLGSEGTLPMSWPDEVHPTQVSINAMLWADMKCHCLVIVTSQPQRAAKSLIAERDLITQIRTCLYMTQC